MTDYVQQAVEISANADAINAAGEEAFGRILDREDAEPSPEPASSDEQGAEVIVRGDDDRDSDEREPTEQELREERKEEKLEEWFGDGPKPESTAPDQPPEHELQPQQVEPPRPADLEVIQGYANLKAELAVELPSIQKELADYEEARQLVISRIADPYQRSQALARIDQFRLERGLDQRIDRFKYLRDVATQTEGALKEEHDKQRAARELQLLNEEMPGVDTDRLWRWGISKGYTEELKRACWDHKLAMLLENARRQELKDGGTITRNVSKPPPNPPPRTLDEKVTALFVPDKVSRIKTQSARKSQSVRKSGQALAELHRAPLSAKAQNYASQRLDEICG